MWVVAGKKETRREGEVTEHTLHNADENIPKKKGEKNNWNITTVEIYAAVNTFAMARCV